MKKLFVLLITLLLLAGCATKTEEADVTEDVTEDTPVEETGWVYDGPGYENVLKTMGKAELDLSNAEGVLKDVIEKGKLVVATSPDYAPAEYVDMLTGDVKGYEMLLAQFIADSIGVELVIETMEFNGVLTALDTGKADLALSGFGYKEDRAEQYELSKGYQTDSNVDHHTILVPTEDLDKYNSLADFDGVTIDAQANSLQQMYVEDQLPNAELQLITSLDEAIMDLSYNKVDAVALDSTTAKNYAETSDGKFVSLYAEKGIEFDLSMYADYSGNVAACKKGETSLMDAVNKCIDKVLADGLYEQMYYAACDDAGVSPDEE